MRPLNVQGVPDDLYNRLTALARTNQMSLDAQVITLLNRALAGDTRRPEQAQVLAEIRRHRFTPASTAPDGTALIREDRER